MGPGDPEEEELVFVDEEGNEYELVGDADDEYFDDDEGYSDTSPELPLEPAD